LLQVLVANFEAHQAGDGFSCRWTRIGMQCWKVAPGVVWIQVHHPEQARALARIQGGRRVAYSVDAVAFQRRGEGTKNCQGNDNIW
jgi:hypothetical protein